MYTRMIGFLIALSLLMSSTFHVWAKPEVDILASPSLSSPLLHAFLDSSAQEALSFQPMGQQFGLKDHGLSMIWSKEGFSASDDRLNWNWQLRLAAFGRESKTIPLSTSRFRANAHRIEYAYPHLIEWHRNTTVGLEQGFTLASPPDGEGNLVLRLALTTDLPLISSDRHTLQFATPSGDVLHYTGLYAYDAAQRELPAWLEYTGQHLVIRVDDRGATYPITIDPLIYVESKVLAADGQAGDEFGVSVAIWGDTAIVGARFGDGPSGADQGAAYVFTRSSAGWALQQKLTVSDGNPGDRFGFSVAIWDDTIAVGAFLADVAGRESVGAVYIFKNENGTWVQKQKLVPYDLNNYLQFGYSLALDYQTLAVGANRASGAVPGAGAVYIYGLSGTTWVLQLKVVAYDGSAEDYFGNSVALWQNTLLVGSPNDDIDANPDQGSAYVFVRADGTWSQEQKLTAGDGATSDEFGTAVALIGDTAFVGAPKADISGQANRGAVYRFNRSSSSWIQQQKITASDGAVDDQFGITVSVYGSILGVGARYADLSGKTDAGAAYLYFMNTSGVWQDEQKLTASTGQAGDEFGNAIAVSNGDIVVGARMSNLGDEIKRGAGYIYTQYWNDTDLSVTATATATKLRPDDAVTVTITLRNNDINSANNVMVAAPLPKNLIYVRNNTDQGTYEPSTGVWFVGSLAGNTTVTLTIDVVAAAQAAGTVNPLFVNLLGRDMDDSNNRVRIDFQIILFTASPEALTFAERLILSTSPAQVVQLTNVSGKPITIGTLSASAGFLLVNNTCNGKVLANGASCSFGVQFKPPAALVYDGKVTIPALESSYLTIVPLHGVGLSGTQLLTNFSFEKNADRNKVPDGWKKTGTWALSDGRDCTVRRSGKCSLKFVGTSKLKVLQYVIFKSGVTGDDFLFTLWSRASSVPATAKYYRIRIELYNGTTLVGSKVVNFAKGTHAFAQAKLPFTAPAAYNKIIVKIEFQAASGTAWFDDASLVWAP